MAGAQPEQRECLLGCAVRTSEKGEGLLRGVGTLRDYFPPNTSVQWQPGDLTIHTKEWFLGAGFLGAPPISLRTCAGWGIVTEDLPDSLHLVYIYIYIYIYIYMYIVV